MLPATIVWEHPTARSKAFEEASSFQVHSQVRPEHQQEVESKSSALEVDLEERQLKCPKSKASNPKLKTKKSTYSWKVL